MNTQRTATHTATHTATRTVIHTATRNTNTRFDQVNPIASNYLGVGIAYSRILHMSTPCNETYTATRTATCTATRTATRTQYISACQSALHIKPSICTNPLHPYKLPYKQFFLFFSFSLSFCLTLSLSLRTVPTGSTPRRITQHPTPRIPTLMQHSATRHDTHSTPTPTPTCDFQRHASARGLRGF